MGGGLRYVMAVDMLDKVTETIAKHELLDRGDAVLVALSGGPDSVALLDVLCRLRDRLKLRIGAVYVNHQIRPRAAAREEQFCAELCERLELDFTVFRENVPQLAKKLKMGIEETARGVRYAVFEQLASGGRYHKVALAHHADDQAETILFRIIRGTGRSGLVGIPIKRGMIIRPMMDVSKSDILEYLKVKDSNEFQFQKLW